MISAVTSQYQTGPGAAARGNPDASAKERAANRGDAVDLSEAARKHIDEAAPPPIRTELVQRVRAELAAGTYLTNEKIGIAAERLRDALHSA